MELKKALNSRHSLLIADIPKSSQMVLCMIKVWYLRLQIFWQLSLLTKPCSLIVRIVLSVNSYQRYRSSKRSAKSSLSSQKLLNISKQEITAEFHYFSMVKRYLTKFYLKLEQKFLIIKKLSILSLRAVILIARSYWVKSSRCKKISSNG